jgi:hypothetical protein
MEKANTGKSGAVRVSTLDATDLAAMERHGRREDASGQSRRVSDDAPLVFGGLDICARQEAHTEGRKQQGRAKALHALVQFPSELIPNNERAQKVMLREAVEFINGFYGGDAVFAARLDRDEKGTHKVDVFFLPRWDFTYKDGRTQQRCGLGQFTKKEAKRRFGREDRRAQGSALQDALFEHLRDKLRVPGVMPPERKAATAKDRLEPEAYALAQDRERDALKRIRDEEMTEEARQQVRLANRALQREKEALRLQREEQEQRQRDLDKQASIILSAKNATGQPVSPDLEHLGTQAKGRRRPQQQQGE